MSIRRLNTVDPSLENVPKKSPFLTVVNSKKLTNCTLLRTKNPISNMYKTKTGISNIRIDEKIKLKMYFKKSHFSNIKFARK